MRVSWYVSNYQLTYLFANSEQDVAAATNLPKYRLEILEHAQNGSISMFMVIEIVTISVFEHETNFMNEDSMRIRVHYFSELLSPI